MTNLLYSGEQFNPVSGLQYLRARWYNPQTGIFNRLDPYSGNQQSPLSFHKYAYAHMNPVMGVDPTGKWMVGLIIGVGISTTAMAVYSLLNKDGWRTFIYKTGMTFLMSLMTAMCLVLTAPTAGASWAIWHAAIPLTSGIMLEASLLTADPNFGKMSQEEMITRMVVAGAIDALTYKIGGGIISACEDSARASIKAIVNRYNNQLRGLSREVSPSVAAGIRDRLQSELNNDPVIRAIITEYIAANAMTASGQEITGSVAEAIILAQLEGNDAW